MRDVMSAKTAAQDTLTPAGRQQSPSPRESGFLLGQEVLLLQETVQFVMIKVKGAAHKQKGVALSLVSRGCPWRSVTDSVLSKSVCLTALRKGGLNHRCTLSHGYPALCQ